MTTVNIERYVFNYPPDKVDVDKINIRMMKNIWSPLEKLGEIKDDRLSYNRLSPELKRTFVHVMAYFSVGDQIVNDNIGKNIQKFMSNCPHGQLFYNLQQGQEAVHTWSYNVYNYYVLGLGSIDQHSETSGDVRHPVDALTANGIFEYLSKLEPIQKKIAWTKRWVDGDNVGFGRNLIAMVITEGIFFSASFAFIYWLKNLNEFHGLSHYNDYISRDEALHCEFGWTYYNNYVRDKISVSDIVQMFTEAVDIEIEFFENVTRGVHGELEKMPEYVKYVADFILNKLNIPPVYRVSNPYAFMKNLSVKTKPNMFERSNTEYATISICSADFDVL